MRYDDDDDAAWWADAVRGSGPDRPPSPWPSRSAWPTGPTPRDDHDRSPHPGGVAGRPVPWVWLGAGLVVVAAVVLLLVVRPWEPASPGPIPAPGPGPATVASTPLGVVSAGASCPVTTGVDAGGTSFTYDGSRAVDGDPATAWRCAGGGVGQQLSLRLDGSHTVTAVGLIPGFDKVDPVDGTDRWVQSPRIASVLWTFDDGTRLGQRFDTGTGPSARSLQTIAVPPTATRTVTVTILAVDPGRTVAGRGPATLCGFSEAHVLGR